MSLPAPALMMSAPPALSIVSLPAPVVMTLALARARNRQIRRDGAGVEILEIGDIDAVAGGLVVAGKDAEIDRGDAGPRPEDHRIGSGAAVGRRLGPADRNGIVASAGIDDVGATAAVDHVGARAARNGVGGRGPHDRDRLGRIERGRIDILESADGGEIAQRLIARREVECRRGAHHQRVGAATAGDRDFTAPVVDRVVAAACIDDVGTARHHE